jgi:hypothetical protein
MKFEVIDMRDKQIKMSTTDESCIYSDEVLLEMIDVGYMFRKNGKEWSPKKRKRGISFNA